MSKPTNRQNEDLFVQPVYPPRGLEQPLVDGAAANLFNARESLALFDRFNEDMERLPMRDLVGKVFEHYLAEIAALPDPADKHLMLYWLNTHTGGGNRLPQLAWAHYEAEYNPRLGGMEFTDADFEQPATVRMVGSDDPALVQAKGVLAKLKQVDWGSFDDKFMMTVSVITAITTLAVLLRRVVTRFRVLRYMVPALGKVGDEFEEAQKRVREIQFGAHHVPFGMGGFGGFPTESLQQNEGLFGDLKQVLKGIYLMISLYFAGHRLVQRDEKLRQVVGPYFSNAASAVEDLSSHAEAVNPA